MACIIRVIHKILNVLDIKFCLKAIFAEVNWCLFVSNGRKKSLQRKSSISSINFKNICATHQLQKYSWLHFQASFKAFFDVIFSLKEDFLEGKEGELNWCLFIYPCCYKLWTQWSRQKTKYSWVPKNIVFHASSKKTCNQWNCTNIFQYYHYQY